jgi:heme-degrading monooxygenase HmoA
VIARVFHGVTTKHKKAGFIRQLERTGLKDFANMRGNKGAYVFARDLGGNTDFMIVSFWDSIDAVKQFAGVDVEKTRFYLNDEDFMLEFEPKIKHYEVVARVPDGA